MDTERELQWLRLVRDLSHRLSEEADPSRLLPKILDAAIEITSAERGFFVRRRPVRPGGKPKIKIEVARGFDKVSLGAAKGSVSRTVVQRVLDSGEGLVTTREEDSDLLEVSSVQQRRVLSILCVPMRLRGRVRGVLYLDHRFVKDTFQEQDLEVLGTFSAQAALAIETAEQKARGAADAERLDATLQELSQLKSSQRPLPAPAPPTAATELLRCGALVGASAVMQDLYASLERMARTWAPVLILGESGTGKELVARELHARSERAQHPLLSINCAAMNDALLESELFGHRQGAFTGADSDRRGLFEQAGQGTLFLDEVGDMSPAMQRKLLRVLQEGQVRPVGAEAPVIVECRVVAATHRDLSALLVEGTFREDLYYRLDVLRLVVPPVRDREGDAVYLFDHFAAEHGGLQLTSAARDALSAYPWPGNVRQLQNEVRRLATLGSRDVDVGQLSSEIRGAAAARPPAAARTMGEIQREAIEAALRDCGGNKAQAARQLGIPRSTLYHLLERHKEA